MAQIVSYFPKFIFASLGSGFARFLRITADFDSLCGMDSQKVANWAQIIGTIIGAITLAYVMWDHIPTGDQSTSVGWEAALKIYIPPAIIALILLTSAILQTFASRLRHSPTQTASESNSKKPTIEILSPFDYDEVGLYETVRGRVFPPDQELQVVILAGDKKWYPQNPVRVRGSAWSAKCQFGNLESPSGGAYKVVALLGNELREGMWYSELPTNTMQSNSITVHRPEVTTESELKTACNERDKYKRQLQTATNAFTDMEEQVEALTTEKDKLQRELVATKKDKQELGQSLQTIDRKLSEARADAEASQAERTGILIERNTFEQKLKETQYDLVQAHLIANQEVNQKNEFYNLYKQSERKLGDLRWLEARMKDQGEHLDTWVRIKRVACVKMQLTDTPRMIIFAFWVHNGSIFDVTFDFDHLAGRVHFKNRPFNDPVRVPPSNIIDTLQPGSGIEIVVEQPLLATEAETVLTAQKSDDPNGAFWLGNLHIPIGITGAPQSFNANKLRIFSEIEHIYINDSAHTARLT